MTGHEDARGRIHGETAVSDHPPQIVDGVPTRCLSLTVRSQYGHFRRVDRTVTKQTYRLPPRTTIAGLLSAIVGVGRDGYYDLFESEVSAVAVGPAGPIRTATVPSLGLGTNPDESFASAGGTGRRTVKVQYPDGTEPRQIHSYEYLVDPVYRIDVAVEDAAFYGTLRERLRTGRSYYPPSMGLSELIAAVEYHGEYTPDRINDPDEVDSALPENVNAVVPHSGRSHLIERLPATMTATGDGRRTTAFEDYAFSRSREPLPTSEPDVPAAAVGDRTVVFR